MEKMKCENCGGSLKTDANKEFATCSYCGTKYKIKDSVDVNIKLDDNIKEAIENMPIKPKHIGTFMLIPFIMIFIFIIIFFMTFKTAENKSKENLNEFNIQSFNSTYEMFKGTQNSIFVKQLIDEVSVNNSQNKNRKITVNYKDEDIKDSEEISKIKKDLDKSKYEISFSYDDDGYIETITIKD